MLYTMPLFPVIGLGGQAALQVRGGLCLFFGFFFVMFADFPLQAER